jgi:Zn finger protein HypA/HybF involved in hydrogenase expression
MLGKRRFRKVKEDFECKQCGFIVKGNGYTDHCPNCLWSMHVDIMPGDRKAECRGMMKPESAIYKNGNYVITYVCIKCKIRKNFKAAEKDNQEILLKITKVDY